MSSIKTNIRPQQAGKQIMVWLLSASVRGGVMFMYTIKDVYGTLMEILPAQTVVVTVLCLELAKPIFFSVALRPGCMSNQLLCRYMIRWGMEDKECKIMLHV